MPRSNGSSPTGGTPYADFDDVHARHARAAWRYIRSHVRTKADADDIFQTSFLELHVSIADRPAVLARAGEELYRLIHKQLKKYGRGLKRRRIDDGAELDDVPASKPDPEEALERVRADADVERRIEATLSQMTTGEATAFRLSRDGALSYDEIASLVGCTLAAVKVRIHRARKKFRELMEPHHDLSKGTRRKP
jgi:RNA polymerase sigma-70 factor (ECF subfamily)